TALSEASWTSTFSSDQLLKMLLSSTRRQLDAPHFHLTGL
ncbi:unnamed protein product, partial [Allacma fusca]